MVWLTDNGFKPEFHDFKKKGITEEKLSQWCDIFGWERVLNKQGTTWKKFLPEIQSEVISKQAAIAILLTNTSAIKRPVIEVDGQAILLGFDEEKYKQLLVK